MRCEEARRLLSDYVDGSLDTETTGRVREHVQSCRACAAVHESLLRTVRLLGSTPVYEPPAWLNKSISDRIRRRYERSAHEILTNLITPNPKRLWAFGVSASLSAVLVTVVLLELLAPGCNFLFSGGVPGKGSDLVLLIRQKPGYENLNPLLPGRKTVLFASDFAVVRTSVDGEVVQAASTPGVTVGAAVADETALPAGQLRRALPAAGPPAEKNIFHKKLFRAVTDLQKILEVNRSLEQKNREIEIENLRISLSNEAIRNFNQNIRRQNQHAGVRAKKPLVPLYLYKAKLELYEAGV